MLPGFAVSPVGQLRQRAPVYGFGRFILHPGRGGLLADAAECALHPKSLALLRHFVENPGRVIGRDEIMQAVWPGVFVTDASIAQCVKDTRRTRSGFCQTLVPGPRHRRT
jgi:DNA-binding winged helix-turn-helix (wHTH) protein